MGISLRRYGKSLTDSELAELILDYEQDFVVIHNRGIKKEADVIA